MAFVPRCVPAGADFDEHALGEIERLEAESRGSYLEERAVLEPGTGHADERSLTAVQVGESPAGVADPLDQRMPGSLRTRPS